MMKTKILIEAIELARQSDCLICGMDVRNIEADERYWQLAKGKPYDREQRKWARVNWRRHVEHMLNHQHLMGKPHVSQ